MEEANDMAFSDSYYGWDPFRSKDRLGELWSFTPGAAMAAGPMAGFRTKFLDLRRLAVGRSLKVRLGKSDLALTVTEFDSQLDLRSLTVGQIGDLHIEARDISWDRYRFDHGTADLRNVHIRTATPAVLVAAPVELSVSFPVTLLEQLVAESSSRFGAELDDDGVARLKWARRPLWGHVELAVQLVGPALWLTPRAVIAGRKRFRLPERVPTYPIRLPGLPKGFIVTSATVESGTVSVRGLLPEWRVDMPRGRLEDLIAQLGVPDGLVNLTRTGRP